MSEGTPGDPVDLSRFVEAQDRIWPLVEAELAAGRKQTHWMWYVFPQIEGLSHSATGARYAIRVPLEARAWHEHPVLGPRLQRTVALLLDHPGRTAREILGAPDDLKLRSSMTLFAGTARAPGPFRAALAAFFDGHECPATRAWLDAHG